MSKFHLVVESQSWRDFFAVVHSSFLPSSQCYFPLFRNDTIRFCPTLSLQFPFISEMRMKCTIIFLCQLILCEYNGFWLIMLRKIRFCFSSEQTPPNLISMMVHHWWMIEKQENIWNVFHSKTDDFILYQFAIDYSYEMMEIKKRFWIEFKYVK